MSQSLSFIDRANALSHLTSLYKVTILMTNIDHRHVRVQVSGPRAAKSPLGPMRTATSQIRFLISVLIYHFTEMQRRKHGLYKLQKFWPDSANAHADHSLYCSQWHESLLVLLTRVNSTILQLGLKWHFRLEDKYCHCIIPCKRTVKTLKSGAHMSAWANSEDPGQRSNLIWFLTACHSTSIY